MHYVLPMLLVASQAVADPPTIKNVTTSQTGGHWTVSVTLSHPDTGWDHYADGWQVETASDDILGTRILHHPHVDEQPFTRSLSGVQFADTLTEIRVRARCSVDGWSSETVLIPLK